MSPRTKSIASSDLYERTLGTGDPTGPLKGAGKDRARRASVVLSGGGSVIGSVKEYDVIHDLGQIPTLCTLESCENAAVPGTLLAANASRRVNWSHSHCHVSITLLAGSFDGCVAHFLVRGK